MADREIRNAIRAAWEKERGFPANVVNQARPRFMDAGLHIWKHRKRILYVSATRPVRFAEDTRNVSAHIADILNVVEESPKCSRADISARLLKPHEAEPEFAKLKGAIISDLHWLVQSGHVIEFHDGTFDLPLLPKDLAKEAQGREDAGAEEKPRAGAAPQEAAEEVHAVESPAIETPAGEIEAQAAEPEVAVAEAEAPVEEAPITETPVAEIPAEEPVASVPVEAEPASPTLAADCAQAAEGHPKSE